MLTLNIGVGLISVYIKHRILNFIGNSIIYIIKRLQLKM